MINERLFTSGTYSELPYLCKLKRMTPEIWTIIGVGIALASLILASLRRLEASLTARIAGVEASLTTRIGRVEAGQIELRERMAHLEGLLEGLREAIAHNRAA